MEYNTIHVFGFGDTQVVKENGGTVKSSELTTLSAFVDYVKTKKPEDVVLTDYHVIHIFKDNSVRYLGKQSENKSDKTNFIIKWEDLDATTLDALVAELTTKITA